MKRMKYDFDEVVNRYGTYSTQWDYVQDRFGKADLLPFTISDMDFKVPNGVSETIVDVARKGLFGYTRWNNPELKNAIVRWFHRRYNCDIDGNWVVYSPSVIFSLAKLVEIYSRPGDLVVTFSPCYDAFIKTISSNDRELIQVKFESFWFDKLENVFSKSHPSIFLLCNPENPLGKAWSMKELEKIVSLCNKYNVNIISDEIHMDIRRKGITGVSLASLFNKIATRSAVITSATKSFNTPSLIFSYALIPEKNDREEFLHILKEKNALSSTSYLGMLALIDCYNNEEQWLDELNEYIDGNFKIMKKMLKDGANLDFDIPEATYLGWIDISPLNISMSELQKELIDNQNVAIMDGKVYGKGGENHLRFNLGAPRSKIVDGLNRLITGINNVKLYQ